MSMPLKNMVISIIMLMIGGGYLYFSNQLPDRTIQNVPGPAFFPTIVSGFILLLALALLIKNLLRLRGEPLFAYKMIFPWQAVMTLAWFVIFLVVMPYTGFLIAAIPFFAGLMLLCERKSLFYIAAGSILMPVFLYYLFRDGFHILLPAGPWM